MNQFEIKPSIEPNDHYQKAFLKLAEAFDAINMLTPDEQKRLACDFFGAKATEEAIRTLFLLIRGY